jgi:hypothetical protein
MQIFFCRNLSEEEYRDVMCLWRGVSKPTERFGTVHARDGCCDRLELRHVVLTDTPRCRAILLAQMGCSCSCNRVLSAIAHELSVRLCDVGGAQMLSRHHQVRDVDGIEAAEWNIVILSVPFIHPHSFRRKSYLSPG